MSCVQDYILWLQVPVDEPKFVQLTQPSSYLKQYFRQLTVVAVLLEIHP